MKSKEFYEKWLKENHGSYSLINEDIIEQSFLCGVKFQKKNNAKAIEKIKTWAINQGYDTNKGDLSHIINLIQ